MGLILVIALIIIMLVIKFTKKKKTYMPSTILYSFFVGFLVAVAIGMPISGALSASMMREDSKIERTCYKIVEQPLEKLNTGAYAMTSYNDTFNKKMLTIKKNNELERIDWDSLTVYLNSSEAKLVTRHYKFKSMLLRIIFYSFPQTEKDLYLPDKMIYGEYDFNDILE